MKKPFMALLLAAVVIIPSVSFSDLVRTTIQLTHNNYDDLRPGINDNGYVAWYVGDCSLGCGLFLYDGTTTIQVTADAIDDVDVLPALNESGHVVWAEDDGSDTEIFLYDGTGTIQLTDNSYPDARPAINNNGYVVWLGEPDGVESEIFLYDGTSTIQLTHNSFTEWGPKINNNGYVQWLGEPDGGDSEIFLYDGTSIIQLTDNSWEDNRVDINDNGYIVWNGKPDDDDWEVFLYDGTSPTRLTDNSFSEWSPEINNNGYVVWSGGEPIGSIFLYDGSSTVNLTGGSYDAGFPDLNNSGHVVWTEMRPSGSWDGEIFLYDGTSTIQLTENSYHDSRPAINSNGYVAWHGFDGSDYEIFLSVLIDVPTEKWAATFGGIYDDYATAVQQTTDGGYILGGGTASFGAGESDFWVLKLDVTGNVLWEKTYGGANTDYASSVHQTEDGGYIVAGRTESFGAGNGDIWILKLDQTGSVQWQNTYGGSELDTVTSIQQTFDQQETPDGYIVAGKTESFGAGTKGDLWVLKLEGDGNVSWQKTYGTTGGGELASSIQQTADGGYIVAGHTYSFGAGNQDFWILKLDSLGTPSWEKTYGGSDIDHAESIQQTSDGGYIVAGNTFSFPESSTTSGVLVLKLESNGAVSWQKVYGTAFWDTVSSIQQTDEGGYIMAGDSGSAGPLSTGDSWIMKLDVEGNMTWQKKYGGADFTRDESLVSIQQAADYGYIAAGGTESFGVGGRDLWILKIDASGEIEDCSAMATWSAVATDTSVTDADTSATVTATSITGTETAATAENSKASLRAGCNPSLTGLTNLAKTGQTRGYYAGDDGALQMGVGWPSPRFTDNLDGTVTDNLTGLMWLKDANCANTIGHDPTGWGEGKMELEHSLDFVAGINDGTHNISACASYSAAYTDWRVPNIIELESLVNAEKTDQANWLKGQGFMNVQPYIYWSSTPTHEDVGGNLYYWWSLHMDDGPIVARVLTGRYHVLPVRAGQQNNPDPDYPANLWKTGETASYFQGDDGDLQMGVAWPSPRFTDNLDGTVTDNLTGLIWLKDANCFEFTTWEGALDTVLDFNLDPSSHGCQDYTATHNDWRLPNRKELISLIDQSQGLWALPSGHPFLNWSTDTSNYWSSTTYANETSNAWYSLIYGGHYYSFYLKDQVNRNVWPVRAGTVPEEPDRDWDGLADSWEQQIIDANPADGITTIDHVLPDDDFDGDGESNSMEYTNGTDPTDPMSGRRGDINRDNYLTLVDAMLALQALSAVEISGQSVAVDGDVTSDGRIGLGEVIYILQKLSGLR